MAYYPISGRDKLREPYARLREQLADGAVALDRSVGWQGGGRLIRDDKQELYLAHTGKVGGGRKGIGKDAFSKWYGGTQRRIRAADGALEDLIILGRIGDPALIESIGEFARKVADFKVEVTGSDVRR
jgi:hypothetical protein